MAYLSPATGAVPLVTMVICPVVVTAVSACFPTAIPVSAICTTHEGAAPHVPLKAMTKPEAGVVPIVQIIDVSVPTHTLPGVPQLVVQVGAVVCAVRI